MKATPTVIRQPEVAGHPPGAEVRSFIRPGRRAGAFDTLFLALGAVALLVDAVGLADIMIISVLERRQEIGLRRALGATRGQIRVQFLSEAIVLELLGGVAGSSPARSAPPSARTSRAGLPSYRPGPGPGV